MTVPEHISVVYVEDDERLARLTQRYLESHGVVVTLARDGREGLATDQPGRRAPREARLRSHRARATMKSRRNGNKVRPSAWRGYARAVRAA